MGIGMSPNPNGHCVDDCPATLMRNAAGTCECPPDMHLNNAQICVANAACPSTQVLDATGTSCVCPSNTHLNTAGECVANSNVGLSIDELNGCSNGRYWHNHDVGCVCPKDHVGDPAGGDCILDTATPNPDRICEFPKYFHSNEVWCVCPVGMRENANRECEVDPRPCPSCH